MPHNRGNYITAKIQFSQDIEKVVLDFKASIPGGLSNKNTDLIKFRLDGCNSKKYNSANPIISALFKQLYQSANFPSACPLKAVSI